MKPPLFVRTLSPEEQHALDQAVRAGDEFTRRRAQILRFSAQRLRPRQIADGLGLSSQAVRNVLHEFEERGLASLQRRAMGPKQPERFFDEKTRERLLEIAHQSPRAFGKARSTWSLPLLAEVAFEQGLTERQVSHETIRQAIHALGRSWKRAKQWIRSPDEQYMLKKNSVTG